MKLVLLILEQLLTISLNNNDSDTKRIWQTENFWGWNNLYFGLSSSTGQHYYIKRSQRDWTRNFPGYLEIGPGEKYTISINLRDGWWDVDTVIEQLKDESVSLKAIFEILPTAEANERSVFVGRIESNIVVSNPPHQWLFAD